MSAFVQVIATCSAARIALRIAALSEAKQQCVLLFFTGGIVLQFFDKTICKYVTELKDGTGKMHHVFKGENGFLKCKVFGKLKELDVPNIMLATETRAGPVLKRPSSMKPDKAPDSGQSA